MKNNREFTIAAAVAVLITALVIGTFIRLSAADRKLASSAGQPQESGAAAEAVQVEETAAAVSGETAGDTSENIIPEESAEAETVQEPAAEGPEPEDAAAEETAQEAGDGESTAEIAAEDEGMPEIDVTSWQYILANPWNEIGDYTPELVNIEGQEFDARIEEPLKEFVEAARAEGLSVFLSSGYRSYETQTYLFNRKAAQYGEEIAATIVARPGTSEHQTGLSCDITDRYYETKDESLENTALYQWMSQHCQEYGFIVRFPKGKQDVTGIIYEPWHFRYVGVEAATYIMENDLTLEEFLWQYDTAEGDAENR